MTMRNEKGVIIDHNPSRVVSRVEMSPHEGTSGMLKLLQFYYMIMLLVIQFHNTLFSGKRINV